MGSSSNFSSGARRQAAHILSQPPFTNKPAHIPDPFAGALHTIGRWLTDGLGKPFAWLWDHFLSLLHGAFGSYSGVVIGIGAVALGVLVAWLLIRRRTRIRSQEESTVAVSDRDEAAVLEAAALEAEEKGDLEGAVRLRFRAGLARLQGAGIIASPLVTTTRQLGVRLHSPTFDELAHRHETIVYAGRPASTEDAAGARRGWPMVLDEARPKAYPRADPGPQADAGPRPDASPQADSGPGADPDATPEQQ